MGKKEDVGLLIRTMRRSRDMTQADLAKAIGQSPSSITMYETGRREPDLETFEALADVFNVPMSSLVSPDEDISLTNVHPKNDDIRLLIRGLNKLTPAQVEQATNVFRAMFMQTNPDLFEKGDDDET